MKKISTYSALEKFGRIRLSKNFFMRDFLYSEMSNFYGVQNLPENPDVAIEAGKQLCEQLLEPLHSTFGRIVIRSAFRSAVLNNIGNEKGHNCASNERNFAHHIWDHPDADGFIGATACIAIPWFMDKYAEGTDWRSLAYWIHDHLPYSELEFFHGEGMCSFNITWSQNPKKNITSWMTPRVLLKNGYDEKDFKSWYTDFPSLKPII
nr:peptidase M15 [uncultured Tolumonas sp.]